MRAGNLIRYIHEQGSRLDEIGLVLEISRGSITIPQLFNVLWSNEGMGEVYDDEVEIIQ